jgi:NADH:ubiquinone oxidoreductase subunit 6 (subunit J)
MQYVTIQLAFLNFIVRTIFFSSLTLFKTFTDISGLFFEVSAPYTDVLQLQHLIMSSLE